MSKSTELDYEHLPAGADMDETDVTIRAYFARMSDERLAEYDPRWTDEQVIEWDGNFKNDGTLMLICCTRDVEIDEYREVLAEHIALRQSAKT
ncbi:MAG: hypothetical protein U1D30_09430 [Planctomycetota bacterium]